MMKNSLGLLLLFIFFSSLFIYPQQNTFTSIELKEQDYFYCSLNKETIYPEVNLTLSYNNNALIIKGVVKKKNFKDGERSWRYGDGFYINFVTPDSNEKAESDKFYGFGFSLINNKPVSVLVNKDGEYFPNVLPPPTPRIFIDSLKNTALYEITIPWKNVYPFHPIKNNPAGINIVYISQNDDGSRIIQQLIDDNYDTELTNKRKFIPLKFSPTFNNELFITGEIENRVTDKNTSDITLFIYSPKQIKNNIYLEISSGGKTVTKKSFARSLSRGMEK